jgi:hypothetical protein
MTTQDLFNSAIGQLDHSLSVLVLASKSEALDEANRQTLDRRVADWQAILGRMAAVAVAEVGIGIKVRVLESSTHQIATPAAVGTVGYIEDVEMHDPDAPYYVRATPSGWAKRVEVIE